MSNAAQVKARPAKSARATTPLMMRIISYALLALVFFLLGFLPLWATGRETAAQVSRLEQALRLADLQNALSVAVIGAQQGEYEPARQAASGFYMALQAEIDRGQASVFSPAEQTALRPLFDERDDVIALLARRDPAAASRLAALYQTYHRIVASESAAAANANAAGMREWVREAKAPKNGAP
jgi:hypothetical protein